MTDQERLVEKQEALQQDETVAVVAVVEPEQETTATDQPVPVAPAVEAVADAPATPDAATPPEVPAESAAVPEADAVLPEAVAPEGVAEAATEPEAVAEAAIEPEGVAEADTLETVGASYTPPAEESGRPRRVKDLGPGMELDGKVTSIALYGIFVDIGVGRDGLVHISEMSDTRIDSPSDVVKIGDPVHVRVKSVDPDGRRISLTMRSRERDRDRDRGRSRKKPDLDRTALADLRVGENVEGTITGLAQFGVFVDIGVGKDGLVHVSELAEGRVEKPEDVVQVGQRYTFKILEVDASGSRISLSLRRAQRTQRLQQLQKGQIVEGTVSGLAPFGAFVDIGVGRDGLVHISELAEGRVGKVEDAVKPGDKIMVRVLEVDLQNKRISLTRRLEDPPPAPPTEERPAREERPVREERGHREERAPRENRGERGERGGRGRQERQEREPEVYTTSDTGDEPFTGNATLEDLMSKYGSNKRDRRRRQDEEEESPEDRFQRRQREAIRRTLQVQDDD